MIKEYLRKNYNNSDFYLRYRSLIDLGTIYDVDLLTYSSIVNDYFKFIRDEIMNGKEFKLPCRLGTLLIVKHQPKEFTGKSLRWDWKATKELGKPVYLLNEHSNGWKYRFFWSKKECLITNKTKYMFIASRANKRDLAQIIFNREHDYVEK